MAGDLSEAPVVFRSADWSVLRVKNAMTDKVSCTGIYKKNYAVQLSETDLFVSYRGGLQSIKLRFDEDPPQHLRLASEVEKKLGSADIEGEDFERLRSSKRLRIEVLSLIRGLQYTDLDLTGFADAYANIKIGCPEAAGSAPPSHPLRTSSKIGICPAKVVERLKARGLGDDALQEVCKPGPP